MDKTQVASNVTLKEMTNIRKAPPLEGGHSHKIGGMGTLKRDISSSKFYEIFLKT